jgi:hypothetical protein
MLHIKIREAIFHPGHYRVALAVNSRDEPPPDPVTTTRGARVDPFRSLRRSIRTRSRRCWRTGCSSTPNVQPRVHSMRPTFASPTSTATSARCRSSNGWVNTLSIRMETTATTTARKSRSRPTQLCLSIEVGQDNPAHADSQHNLPAGRRWRLSK